MVPSATPYGTVPDGAIAVTDGRVVFVGPRGELPSEVASHPARVIAGDGGWVTPGLIDCHTHLVFGGNRAEEFEARLGGASYEEIAWAGGGILSTVAATRAASEDELRASAGARIATLRAHGVTTVEIKSGYGLELETEIQMLRVARAAGDDQDVTTVTTLLGAHALPPEAAGDRDVYLDLVCEEMIPAAVGVADAVDAFCEGIAFTPEECRRVLQTGAGHGLYGRLHADQLSDIGGAAVAAACGARSADHLEYTSEAGVRAMAQSGTVPVLLPGAFLYLNEERRPPVAAMREAGLDIAVATDLNPGSSPIASPLIALNLACLLFGLTPEESLAGMTRVAARVLDMEGSRGTLTEGAHADLALWDIEHPAELSYWMGANPCRTVIRGGRAG
jgi:imidazolonepropionase